MNSNELTEVTEFPRVVKDGDGLRLEVVPIEEHPHFAKICAVSSWHRERFARAGNAWIHPDNAKRLK